MAKECLVHAWQGVCKNGVCVCNAGYRGAYCEIPPACAGILDAVGNCCLGGVVSQNGTCCGAVRRMPQTLNPYGDRAAFPTRGLLFRSQHVMICQLACKHTRLHAQFRSEGIPTSTLFT